MSGRFGFLLAMGIALLARAGVLVTIAPTRPTTWESEEIATNLAEGRGFSYQHLGTTYRAYKPPLYEWLCAGIYRVTQHNQRVVITLQCAWGAALAGITVLIGTHLFGTATGLLAGLLVAVHPALVYYDTCQLHPLTLAALLMSLIVWGCLKVRDCMKWWRALALGVLIGLAAHERGTAGLLVMLAVGWVLMLERGPQHTRIRWVLPGSVLLGFFVTVAPWTLRNLSIYGRPVFMTTLTGELFWRGNNSHATGTTVTADLAPILKTASPEFRQRLMSMDELGQQVFFRREALAFVRAHPVRAFHLFMRKLFYFWWFAATSGYLYPHRYLVIYRGFYIALLLLLCCNVKFWMAIGRPVRQPELWLIPLMVVSLSLAQAVFYVEIRHRWAIEPLLIILAASGLHELLRTIRSWMSEATRARSQPTYAS